MNVYVSLTPAQIKALLTGTTNVILGPQDFQDFGEAKRRLQAALDSYSDRIGAPLPQVMTDVAMQVSCLTTLVGEAMTMFNTPVEKKRKPRCRAKAKPLEQGPCIPA